MSSLGRYFRISTFGESHCKGVGCIIDGVPPLLELTEEDIQPQLTRRRPGQSALTTPRNEKDKVTILSGVEGGKTLGTPIALFVPNEDQRPQDYQSTAHAPRPSHADYTYKVKYGIQASSGGGRSSARETIGRVAAGAVAEKWLSQQHGIEIVAWVSQVGTQSLGDDEVDVEAISRKQVDSHGAVRCGTADAVGRFSKEIERCKADNDSTGGVITCVCRNVPAGLGEPVFEKLEAKLAQAMLSIPATKGFEIGSGFAGTKLRGSEHNDKFIAKGSRLGTETNNSGGVQGGISNGETILFRVAFKPPATIGQAQTSVNYDGQKDVVTAKGRHDPCVVPRAVPIVEAMAALVLADVALAQLAREAASPKHLGTDIEDLSFDDLKVRFDRELRLREQYQRRLQKKAAEDEKAFPKKYLYPTLVGAGLLAGVFLGRKLFANTGYSLRSPYGLNY